MFPPSYVALWDSKTPHTPTGERVSWCLETSPLLQLRSRVGSPSLTLLSLFLSFIFCPASFRKQWAAFLGAWCPLLTFRSCFAEFAQRSNDLSMNLCGRKWFLHHLRTPPPLSPISRDSLVPLCFLPLGWCHLHFWSYWYFSWQSWFQLVFIQPGISHDVHFMEVK